MKWCKKRGRVVGNQKEKPPAGPEHYFSPEKVGGENQQSPFASHREVGVWSNPEEEREGVSKTL